jgi:dephospho-CoA kinase
MGGSKRIPIIGLTGGIGSGKSAVANILRDCGCVVADADQLAKAALKSPEVRTRLIERWGEGVYSEDGEADREAIATIVFEDDQQRSWLESILHPIVEAQRAAQFAAAPAGTVALVIDAPLLLEANLAQKCDSVIFVEADAKVRLKRLKAARGWTKDELDRREQAQMPLDEKRSMAHHVLKNEGGVDDLARSVEDYLDTLILDQSSRPNSDQPRGD